MYNFHNLSTPLLDGVLSYLPCPTEVSSYALDQSKNEVAMLVLRHVLQGDQASIFI